MSYKKHLAESEELGEEFGCVQLNEETHGTKKYTKTIICKDASSGMSGQCSSHGAFDG